MVEDSFMIFRGDNFKVLVVYTLMASMVYNFKVSIRDNLMVSWGNYIKAL